VLSAITANAPSEVCEKEAPRLNLRRVRTLRERPLWNTVGKRVEPQSDCGKRRAQKLGTVLCQRSRHRRCVRRWHACR